LNKAQQAPQAEHGFNFNGETCPLHGDIGGRALDIRIKAARSGPAHTWGEAGRFIESQAV
jgi:hypothetical protein